MGKSGKDDVDYLMEYVAVAVSANATKFKQLAEETRKQISHAKNVKTFDQLVDIFQGQLSGSKLLNKITGKMEKAVSDTMFNFQRNGPHRHIYTKLDSRRICEGTAEMLLNGQIPPEIKDKTEQIQHLSRQVKELQKVNKGLKTDLELRSTQLEKAVKNLHNIEVSVMNTFGIKKDQINEWKKKPAQKKDQGKEKQKVRGIS